MFMLDPELQKQGVLQLKYPIPYSDLVSLTPEELQPYLDSGEALVFGHACPIKSADRSPPVSRSPASMKTRMNTASCAVFWTVTSRRRPRSRERRCMWLARSSHERTSA